MMSKQQTTVRHLLASPRLYLLSQWLWYRRGQQQLYVDQWIRPTPGDHILDIGCGPGTILKRMPAVHYVGYDPHLRYIQYAKTHFGDQANFRHGTLVSIPPDDKQTFDIVLANGVLHHLPDDEARHLLRVAWDALKPGGRLVTRDGCWENGPRWLVRLLLRKDRGAYVRTRLHYEALIRERFQVSRAEILHTALRLPYSLLHFEARKPDKT